MKVILQIPGSVLLVKIQFIVAMYFGFLFVPLLCINRPQNIYSSPLSENSLKSCKASDYVLHAS